MEEIVGIVLKLRTAERIGEGLSRIVFDQMPYVDGQPQVILTIQGSFSLDCPGTKSVVPAA